MIWVVGIACIIVGFGVISVDNKEQEHLFDFLVSLLAILFFLLGALTRDEVCVGIKSDKPLTPSVEIKCKDGKCDTIYIYKGGNNVEK